MESDPRRQRVRAAKIATEQDREKVLALTKNLTNCWTSKPRSCGEGEIAEGERAESSKRLAARVRWGSIRGFALMHERIRLINHHGKQVLFVDLSNCSAVEVEKIARAVPEFVTTQPRGSVLILSDFTGASFNEEAVRVMKESAVFDKPYIKKSAWVGAESFSEAFRENLKSFSRREFPTFKNRRKLCTR
jgi:hypothetical protein